MSEPKTRNRKLTFLHSQLLNRPLFKAVLGVSVAGIVLLSATLGRATSGLPSSCFAPKDLNCGFYSACLESKFQCGADGYPVGYGEKYCERFMSLNTAHSVSSSELSPDGIRWRNSTLICLQRALVNTLPYNPSVNSCDELHERH